MNFHQMIVRSFLGKRLPITEGEIEVTGLSDSVQIRRDKFGVPYILAKTENDGWYGLGFCHGQDRAFQLETLLRLVHGSLSEIFGEDALPVDRMSRRIGFLRAGRGHLALMPESQRVILEAYVEGLNAGLTTGSDKLAHEFVLLRSRPSPWEAADVLAYMNYMGIVLSGWTSKLTRLFILKNDGVQALTDLDPGYPEWKMVTSPVKGLAGDSVDRLLAEAEKLFNFLGNGMSNNWSLNGSRTASGNPILANDPHLSPRLPAPWYLAHLRYPGLTVAGGSFPGMPLIPSGFNGTSAWGVTAGLVDGIDLFIEKLDAQSKTVQSGSTSQPCEVLKESYNVKGRSEPFEEEILITPRGPIISDLHSGLSDTISIKATWMKPRPVNGLTNFHKATDFQSCRENFASLFLVSMNVAYADTNNDIGWQLVGEAPRRKTGTGDLPIPGWDPAYEWESEHVSMAEMPWDMNPAVGFIATANNQPQPKSEELYLGRDFVPYRHARIVEMLDTREDWDLQSTLDLQLDRLSVPWREMSKRVLEVSPGNDQAVWARETLLNWDGRVEADSVGAAVYEFFVISLAQHLARVKAPNSTERVLGKGFSRMFRGSFFFIRHPALIVKLLREKPAGWFEQGWDDVIEAALVEAVNKLENVLGADKRTWRWGDAHQLVFSHYMGARKPLEKVFNRGPYPYGGDHETVAQAGRSVENYSSPVIALANLRMAVEVGDWEKNYFIIAGGQSGNPLSPHYDDQLNIWLDSKAISIAWSEEKIAARTSAMLVLKPGSPKK